MNERDPVFHAGITDCLPDDHPLAYTQVVCASCGALVHAFNNETMTEWFETGKGAWCWECFVSEYDGENEWGLP